MVSKVYLSCTEWYGVVRCSTGQYGAARCGTMWYGLAQFGTWCYGVVRSGTARYTPHWVSSLCYQLMMVPLTNRSLSYQSMLPSVFSSLLYRSHSYCAVVSKESVMGRTKCMNRHCTQLYISLTNSNLSQSMVILISTG